MQEAMGYDSKSTKTKTKITNEEDKKINRTKF